MDDQFVCKNGLVGYFDLLGFKNYVNKNPCDAVYFYNYLDNVLNNFKDFISPKEKELIRSSELTKKYLSLNIFSDSIVFCFDLDGILIEENITEEIAIWRYLSITCYLVQNIFCYTGLLIRGSIQKGNIFIKKFTAFNSNQFLYSNTHCENVYIEEEIANTPRIIISEMVVNTICKSNPLLYFNESAFSQILQDNDGLFYLNTYWWEINNVKGYNFLKRNKEIIEKNINENKTDFKRMKYLKYWNWFKNYHNSTVSKKMIDDKKNTDLLSMYRIN
jgi:hypothetical protein